MWVTRDPDESVDGWAVLFPIPAYMTDGMSVILIGIILFVLPIGDSGLFAMFNCFKNEENKIDVSKFYLYRTFFKWFQNFVRYFIDIGDNIHEIWSLF